VWSLAAASTQHNTLFLNAEHLAQIVQNLAQYKYPNKTCAKLSTHILEDKRWEFIVPASIMEHQGIAGITFKRKNDAFHLTFL
jgi:hypothetical protein